MEMEEVFPTLAQLPGEISSHLQNMIHCLEQAVLQGELPIFKHRGHISEVLDTDGNLRCLFKEFCDGDEQSARNEACAYILDHPEDDHRSRSSQIYGFSGVPPCVFVRFRMGNKKKMGVLVEFVKSKGTLEVHGKAGIALDEIHKIVVADIRLGNMDRRKSNLLVREGENKSLQLVPIDHEMSFANTCQDYNIINPCWRDWLRSEEDFVTAKFSQRSMDYVRGLNPDDDVAFLSRCGWQPGIKYIQKLKVSAIFLKKAVSLGIAAYDIGLMASFKCIGKEEIFNLQTMVDGIAKDDVFFANLETHIEQLMRKYLEEKK